MSTIRKILIAADASDASPQVVNCVGDMICATSRTKFHVGLAHLVLPPRMKELRSGSLSKHITFQIQRENRHGQFW